MSLGQALNLGQSWSSDSYELGPGFGEKRYVHTCACMCVLCVPAHVCMCVRCMHVCVCWRRGDQGGAPIHMVPTDVSQESVFCPSPAHLGEQSSFQLTAACVC